MRIVQASITNAHLDAQQRVYQLQNALKLPNWTSHFGNVHKGSQKLQLIIFQLINWIPLLKLWLT